MPTQKPPTSQELATMAAQIAELKKLCGDDADAKLVLDTIEGQTQTLEAIDVLLDHIIARELMMEHAKLKAKHWEQRADKLRADVQFLMEKIGTKSLQRPLGTLSLSPGNPSVVITDEDAIPIEFLRMAPDKTQIAKVLKMGGAVDGAQLNNAPTVLTLRTK